MREVAIGVATGILSSCGLGGGTLLLIYFMECTTISQPVAQGINLLFFIPSGLLALPAHKKGGYLKKEVILPTTLGGLLGAFLGAYGSRFVSPEDLRGFFGWFLLVIGGIILFQKEKTQELN